jgi:hypothetical protein
MSSKMSSDIPIGTKVILHSLKTTKLNGQEATMWCEKPFDDENGVLRYKVYVEAKGTYDIKPENFKVVELPIPIPLAPADSFDEEDYDFVDESECPECSKCVFCTDNIIQTDKGSELCSHNCNCHCTKQQLSEWYSAAVNDNTSLVAANTAFFQANTELVANNKALVDANLALQKQIEKLKSQLENATTK